MGREGEEELRLKATLGLIPKSEGTSQKSNNKNLQQEEAERGGSDASPARPLRFTASLRPGRVPCSGTNPLLGSVGAKGPSPPSKASLLPTGPLLAPEKQRRREVALVAEVPFPFLLCTPGQLAPPRFLPTAGEGKCQ